MFVFLFLCIYTNPATGCYMNKTILCVWKSEQVQIFGVVGHGWQQQYNRYKSKTHNCKTCYSTADGDLESKRHRHEPKETTCTITDMEYRIIRVRKLGAEEVRWETSNSFWDVGMAPDAENQLDSLDRTENENYGFGRRLVYQKKKAS